MKYPGAPNVDNYLKGREKKSHRLRMAQRKQRKSLSLMLKGSVRNLDALLNDEEVKDEDIYDEQEVPVKDDLPF